MFMLIIGIQWLKPLTFDHKVKTTNVDSIRDTKLKC